MSMCVTEFFEEEEADVVVDTATGSNKKQQGNTTTLKKTHALNQGVLDLTLPPNQKPPKV